MFDPRILHKLCVERRAFVKTKSQSILTSPLGRVKKYLSQLNTTVG